MNLKRLVRISLIALSLSMLLPIASAAGCSGAPSSNTRNPDTGAPLSEGQQFFVTNQSGGPNGTVLLVTAVYSSNPGGSVWGNNGAWGTVVVGGTLVMGASHTYYPPGCKTPTPVAVTTPTPTPRPDTSTATTTPTPTPRPDTSTATTTPTPTPTSSAGCSGAPSSNTRNPDTGAPLSEGQQFFVTNQRGGPNGTVLLVTAVYSSNPGGSVWGNNGAWGTVEVGGTLVMGASHTYYRPGCKTATPVAVSAPTPTPSATDTRTATTKPTATTTTQSETRTAAVAVVAAISNVESRTVTASNLLKTYTATEKENLLNVTLNSAKSAVVSVSTDIPNIKMVVTATKTGSKPIVFNIKTNSEGDGQIKTSKNLTGYTVTLSANGVKLDSDKAIKK